MRVYVPATMTDLLDDSPQLSPRPGRAVTASLRAALGPEADEEMAEFAALVLAAEDSLARLAYGDVMRRVVVAAEVADEQVTSGSDLARVAVPAVPVTEMVSVHVDSADPHVRELVSRAITGDQEAMTEVGQADLLWYDVSERAVLVAEG